ncbi:MAG: HAMP domain-containing protein [Alphaproteobacteria bacterium]
MNDYRDAEKRRGTLQTLFGLSYLSTAWLVLLAAVWLGLSNATRISEPIGALADAAARVASGDVGVRVQAGSARDEVQALGRAFNRMSEQIEAQRDALVRARSDAEQRSASRKPCFRASALASLASIEAAASRRSTARRKHCSACARYRDGPAPGGPRARVWRNVESCARDQRCAGARGPGEGQRHAAPERAGKQRIGR